MENQNPQKGVVSEKSSETLLSARVSVFQKWSIPQTLGNVCYTDSLMNSRKLIDEVNVNPD